MNNENTDQAILWTLYRIDDNNNKFIMKSGLEKEVADSLLKHYDSLHHKQTYFIEQQ